jgi:hypothetical protein
MIVLEERPIDFLTAGHEGELPGSMMVCPIAFETWAPFSRSG